MTVQYFAYGSNLSRARLKRRVGGWEVELNVVVDGYKLTFDSRGKADIIKANGSRVNGVLYELSETQMKELDRCEGVDSGVYKRLPVKAGGNGRVVDAVAYVKVERTAFHAPEPKYLAFITNGLSEHGYDQEAIDEVKRIARCTD